MGRQLDMSMADYREMLNNSYDGFMIMDPDGCIVYANSAYLRLTASVDSDIIGKNMHSLIDKGILKASSALIALERKKVVSFHHAFPDQTRVFTTSQPVLDARGKVTKIITNVRDMTEIAKLKQALDEAEELVNTLPQDLHFPIVHDESGIVAVSDQMKKVLSLARKVSGVDVTVLIVGESGVGKEVVANFIHRQSPRSDRKMLSVNCGAIPAGLLESELFGYSAGAFTGALKEGKQGIFEAAKGGTLFLDEIGDTTPDFQLKLLRALEARIINRVGDHKDIPVDVRVVSATNRSLADMVERGTFRKDLYYRLNVVEIEIPPLRTRPDDIIPLALFYLAQYNSRYELRKKMSAAVLKELRMRDWPGNNRELKNFVERLVVLSEGNKIDINDYRTMSRSQRWEPKPATGDEVVTVQDVAPMRQAVASTEKQLLRMAFERLGRTSAVSRELRIDASTITRKMNKYGLMKKDRAMEGNGTTGA